MNETMPAAAFLEEARHLPALTADGLAELAPLVVLAPHPDDESLGCGALIAAARAARLSVRVVLVSDGTGSHPGSKSHPPGKLQRLREREFANALAALGADPARRVCLGLRDTAVPLAGTRAFEQAVALLDAQLGETPSTIVTTWRHDPHRDHAATYALARALQERLKPQPRLLEYPVWGFALPEDTRLADGPPRGFTIEVEPHRERKERAIACHRSQTTGLITDVEGFRLEPAMIERSLEQPEVFLEMPA
ncbi:PIG-L deacetylase family protein [Geminicoccaceae bacterium 1502E]|nr:PIG-L deacetylase family protein [Geminicoccaceae bacterium 1502E]